MPSNHLILCHPLLFLPSIFPSIRVFLMSRLFESGGQSTGVHFSITPSNEYSGTDFLQDWLVWSPCSPKDSLQSSAVIWWIMARKMWAEVIHTLLRPGQLENLLCTSPSSSPAFNTSQHQGICQWVSSSHQAAKILELELQPKSFQWILKIDLLAD